MVIYFSDDFDRQFESRLTQKEKIQVIDTIDLFLDSPFHKDLRNHELKDKWAGYRSISVAGDLRLHFKVLGENVYFVAVGTHEQLYK
ncbi:MAG TPA: type II toxin-antitoxin system mRNA interferase toxin, RelE/StbE family [Candidatus Saccharimonadales bacterium]|nr:type II toxin-antitoxin system mRNA interferase toxin, RelE/StbE family [Candidatus Saccharimonadales bacterium]